MVNHLGIGLTRGGHVGITPVDVGQRVMVLLDDWSSSGGGGHVCLRLVGPRTGLGVPGFTSRNLDVA